MIQLPFDPKDFELDDATLRVWHEKNDPLSGPAVGHYTGDDDAPPATTLNDIDNTLLCIRDELMGINATLKSMLMRK